MSDLQRASAIGTGRVRLDGPDKVRGLAPGPHTFGIRFVEPWSDAAGSGPTVSVGFTVAGP